jgi:hypothetical protein
MKLSDVKQALATLEIVTFQLPNGDFVPGHFHVTEIGVVTKDFIDCGGTLRSERFASFQLWNSNDIHHRLNSGKLVRIIELSEKLLGMQDYEVEVEFQLDTIGKYGLEFHEGVFKLTRKITDCLAPEKCAVPEEKPKMKLSELTGMKNSCAPGSGCCQ